MHGSRSPRVCILEKKTKQGGKKDGDGRKNDKGRNNVEGRRDEDGKGRGVTGKGRKKSKKLRTRKERREEEDGSTEGRRMEESWGGSKVIKCER